MSRPRVQRAAITTLDSMRAAMRDAFLEALVTEAPDAIRELRNLPTLAGIPTAPEPAALVAWAERWRVAVAWVTDACGAYFAECVEWPAHADQFRPSITDGGWRPIETLPLRGWNPYVEDAEAFRARVERYITDVQAGLNAPMVLQGDKMVPATDHVVPVRRDRAVFRRLVRYQVLGWNFKQVADADGLYSDSANMDVAAALRDLAQEIDLPFRPPQRGRPRKY
jgi:hypothetical protein